MRILQINTTINYSSTGKIAERIGLKIINNGGESYIAAGYGLNSASKSIFIGNKFDRVFHIAITRLFDAHGLGSVNSTKALIRSIIKLQPDIIHLHNLHGYYVNFKLLFVFLKSYNKKVIWTLHDCWAFTGHCSHFERVGCYKWKTQCSKCPLVKRYPASWLFDRSRINYLEKKNYFCGLNDLTIVVPSKWLSEQVKNSFLGNYSLKVINNGIDLYSFNINKSCNLIDPRLLSLKKKVILGVANVWDPIKGYDDFIRLSTAISNDYVIFLVGLSEYQLKGLPNNVLGIKRTSNLEELAQLYSYALVYVNPTYIDTFPTTNIEALACGTPVITYKSGGSPEIIDTNTGIVCDKGDINAILKAIDVFSKVDRGIIQKNCRARAEKLYDDRERINDYLDLYFD